jgi:hypothetical protein
MNDTPMAAASMRDVSRPEGILPEMDSMDGALENLFDEIQRLTDKVGILLKPETDFVEKYAGGSSDPGLTSEMRLMIGSRTDRVRRASGLLYALRERIDL